MNDIDLRNREDLTDDEKWSIIREHIHKRDKGDRMLRIISAKDAIILKKKAGSLYSRLDCAHILPRSLYPVLKYNSRNIILLNRWSHTNLDNCKDPITGASITVEERDYWWERLAKKEWGFLKECLDKNP